MNNYEPLFDMNNPFTGLEDTYPITNNGGMNQPGANNFEILDDGTFFNTNFTGPNVPYTDMGNPNTGKAGANMVDWSKMPFNTVMPLGNDTLLQNLDMPYANFSNVGANVPHTMSTYPPTKTPGEYVPEATITMDDLTALPLRTTPIALSAAPTVPLTPSPTPQTRRQKPKTPKPRIMDPTTNRIIKRTNNPLVQAAGARLRTAQDIHKLPMEIDWEKLTRLQRCQVLNAALKQLVAKTNRAHVKAVGAETYGVRRQQEALQRKARMGGRRK